MKRFVLFFQNRCQGLCTLFLTLVGIFSLAIFLFPEMATAVTDKDVVAPKLTADVGDSGPHGRARVHGLPGRRGVLWTFDALKPDLRWLCLSRGGQSDFLEHAVPA